MPSVIACAVVRDDPPTVITAEDLETLNWVLALRLIATTPGRQLPVDLRDELRLALAEASDAPSVPRTSGAPGTPGLAAAVPSA